MIPNTTQEQNRIIPHKDYQPNQTARGKNTSPAFRGLVDGAFVALEGSELLGPVLVDVVGMITPRTVIDFTRGKDAGWETVRRETSAGVNSFMMPGVYALGAGLLLTKFKGSNLFIAGDMVDELKGAWKKGESSEKFVRRVLNNSKGLVGNKNVKFSSKKMADKFASKLAKLIDNPPEKVNPFVRFWDVITRKNKGEVTAKKLAGEAVKVMRAEKTITVGKVETGMKHLFCNIVDMGRVLKKNPAMADKIKMHGLIKSGVGVGLAVVGGFVLQYVNRYMTAKKTGSTAFVGLPDYERNVNKNVSKETESAKKKEKQGGLFPWKLAAAGTMLYMMAASCLKQWNPLKMPSALTRKNLRGIIEMKSKAPSLNNLKLIVGSVLAGRMFAASDKYELRESAVRDILITFPFLLIVGDLVNQLTAWKLAKKGGLRNKVFNGNVHAVSQIKNPLKRINGILGLKMKTYGEMGLNKAAKSAKQKAVGIGYLFSSVVAGVGVPLLNKAMTNSAYRREHQDDKRMDKFMKTVPVAKGFGV